MSALVTDAALPYLILLLTPLSNQYSAPPYTYRTFRLILPVKLVETRVVEGVPAGRRQEEPAIVRLIYRNRLNNQ